MHLAIDVGNTRTKIALFESEKLVHLEKVPLLTEEWFAQWAYNHSPKKAILSSVGTRNPALIAELQARYPLIVLDHQTPLPIANEYRTPETLGKDRVAAVVGAFQLYPGKSNVVIDAGTCITYDLITHDGIYYGGNIAPGITMRLDAMQHFTARLPQPGRSDIHGLLGDSTNTALQNGAQLGAILEAEGFIKRCEATYGELNVILTGGDADFFDKYLKRNIFVNQNLVLHGLNQILIYNAPYLA
ncbi:MAG: type III pantothenate kinase [Bacteroidota bacterium]